MFKYIVIGGSGFGRSRLFFIALPLTPLQGERGTSSKPKRQKTGKGREPIKQKNMKKAISFIKIAGYVFGAIGGLGWSLYNHGYVVAAGCVILAWLAWPELKKSIDNLTE